MVDTDLEFVKKKLFVISHRISKIKRLSKILYNLLLEPVGDINEPDIMTLASILNDNILLLTEKMNKLEVKLKM